MEPASARTIYPVPLDSSPVQVSVTSSVSLGLSSNCAHRGKDMFETQRLMEHWAQGEKCWSGLRRPDWCLLTLRVEWPWEVRCALRPSVSMLAKKRLGSVTVTIPSSSMSLWFKQLVLPIPSQSWSVSWACNYMSSCTCSLQSTKMSLDAFYPTWWHYGNPRVLQTRGTEMSKHLGVCFNQDSLSCQ